MRVWGFTVDEGPIRFHIYQQDLAEEEVRICGCNPFKDFLTCM